MKWICTWNAQPLPLGELKWNKDKPRGQKKGFLDSLQHCIKHKGKKHEWPEKRQPIDKSDTTSRETHLSKTKPIFEDDLFRMSLLVLCFKLFITTLYILTTVHRLNAENEEFSNIVSILLGWHHLHYCWKHWFQ